MKALAGRFAYAILLAVLGMPSVIYADPVSVRHPQGSAHGFVALSTLDGKRIAIGDMTQTIRGRRVTSRLTLRFRDGSLDDEVTVFTQQGVFRLVSDHHVQRGPSFPKPIDMLIDTASGQVTSRGEDGKLSQEHLDLPADLANGLPPNLLMNLDPSMPEKTLSFIAPLARPRLVHATVKPAGKVFFTIGNMRRTGIDYALHVELGGITGMIAPLIGKEPPDYHIWILPGAAPAFIREEGPLYFGGPVWRIEQISPTFPTPGK